MRTQRHESSSRLPNRRHALRAYPPGTMAEWFPWLTKVEEDQLFARARAWLAEDPLW